MTDADTAGGSPRAADAPRAPEAHVMVVDDDERIRALLRRFLGRSG